MAISVQNVNLQGRLESTTYRQTLIALQLFVGSGVRPTIAANFWTKAVTQVLLAIILPEQKKKNSLWISSAVKILRDQWSWSPFTDENYQLLLPGLLGHCRINGPRVQVVSGWTSSLYFFSGVRNVPSPWLHQDFQVPKMEVLNVTRLFWWWAFPYRSLTYSLYRWVPPF